MGSENDVMNVDSIFLCMGAIMSFEEALALASRDEGFKATVYAMNSLLIHKGIYTEQELQALFVEWIEKEQKRKVPAPRPAASSAYQA
jgi:hypothetical protein